MMPSIVGAVTMRVTSSVASIHARGAGESWPGMMKQYAWLHVSKPLSNAQQTLLCCSSLLGFLAHKALYDCVYWY